MHSECLNVMRQLRRTADVSKEFNEVYRALTSDAKLGNDWWDLWATKSIVLRLVCHGFFCIGVYCCVLVCIGVYCWVSWSMVL